MVRTISKQLFSIDTESPTTQLLENDEEKAALDSLLDITENGDINETENKIFEIADIGGEASFLKILDL